MRSTLLVWTSLVVSLAACGGSEAITPTVAQIERVRAGVTLTEPSHGAGPVDGVMRLVPGAVAATDDVGRALLVLDHIKAGDITNASVYFRDMTSNEWTVVNDSAEFKTSSTRRMSVLLTYLRMAEQDPQLFQRMFEVEGRATENAAPFGGLQCSVVVPGHRYSVRQLLESDVKCSDDLANSVLMRHIDKDMLRRTVQDLRGIDARLLVAEPEARIGNHDRHRRQRDEIALVDELEIIGLCHGVGAAARAQGVQHRVLVGVRVLYLRKLPVQELLRIDGHRRPPGCSRVRSSLPIGPDEARQWP